MRRIILGLIVLSVVLAGMSCAVASSDVDNVHCYADGGNGFNTQPGYGPYAPHDNPSQPCVNPDVYDQIYHKS